MPVITKTHEFSTQGNTEAVDLTAVAQQALAETALRNGVVTLFAPGATAGITTVEFEPGLLEDLRGLWEKIAPAQASYAHDKAWEDGNGHSHLRATLVGPSLAVPFCDGVLTLGQWQQIIFVDFDAHPRRRKVVMQFMGEK
jgi:secondary thiamine-phosphate synthase enzyme